MPDDKIPPKKWWDDMYKEIKDGNPGYSDEQIRKTIGDIWYNELSESKRKEIRSRSSTQSSAPARFSNRNKNKTADSFMEEQVVQGNWIEVDGPAGMEWVEADLVDLVEVEELKNYIPEAGGKVQLDGTTLGPYTENRTATGIEILEGWWGARLSAPGYMDRTEWTVFKTEEEAHEFLMEEKEFYGEEDLEELEDDEVIQRAQRDEEALQRWQDKRKSKKAQDDSTEGELAEALTKNIKILEDLLAVFYSYQEDVKNKVFDQIEMENILDELYLFFHKPVKIDGDIALLLDEVLARASRKAQRG